MNYRTKLANAAHDYELGVKTAAISLEGVKGMVSSAKQRAKQRAKDIARHISGSAHAELAAKAEASAQALEQLRKDTERTNRMHLLGGGAVLGGSLLGHHLRNRDERSED